MLSFAMPGTVVGISYILAFNAPPIELAYTGIILVACFVFRDMTTSLRAGLASLAQIDPSLDEASATMRAGTTVDAAPRRAAAHPPGDRRRARLQLHQRDDVDQRGDLPHEPALRHGHRQHRRPRGGGRVRLRDGVCVGADRADADRGAADPRARGEARACRHGRWRRTLASGASATGRPDLADATAASAIASARRPSSRPIEGARFASIARMKSSSSRAYDCA